jgi:nitrogen-specific signal transduction histidine kinase
VRQVEDTGTGILPDVLAQIGDACDPTKQNGKGTGQATDLGLSTVRGMVAPHGFVTVQSQAAAAPPSAFSTPRPKAPSARRPSPPPSPSSTATANSASSSSPK